MKIGIMGTPVSSGNRGVLALGASLINLCSQAPHAVDVVLLLGNRDNKPACFRVGGELRMIPVVNCRMSPRSRPQDHLAWILLMSLAYRFLHFRAVRAAIARSTPWIRTLIEADIVGDVRGGDSFSDTYGLRRFLMGFLISWTVVLVKGTMVQFPQTYGPYRIALSRWLARVLLKRSSLIIARDKQSRQVARELAGPEKQVLLSPDVAFSLEALPPERIELNPPLSGLLPPNIIGLNVNGLMYNGGYTRDNMFGLKLDYASFLPSLIAAWLRENQGEIWLIPHTFAPDGNVESDPEASRKVRAAVPPDLRPRIRIINRDYDQHEIKGVIGKCDFFIGSRMHACIAALSQGIPCAAIAYSRKFEGVFDSVGMRDWVVDGRLATNAEAVQRVLELYRLRNGVRVRLGQKAEEARAQLQAIFRGLVLGREASATDQS